LRHLNCEEKEILSKQPLEVWIISSFDCLAVVRAAAKVRSFPQNATATLISGSGFDVSCILCTILSCVFEGHLVIVKAAQGLPKTSPFGFSSLVVKASECARPHNLQLPRV
jgi:hypothetical protein